MRCKRRNAGAAVTFSSGIRSGFNADLHRTVRINYVIHACICHKNTVFNNSKNYVLSIICNLYIASGGTAYLTENLGSNAFFPFSDNIERAKKSGVKYIAEPGGRAIKGLCTAPDAPFRLSML